MFITSSGDSPELVFVFKISQIPFFSDKFVYFNVFGVALKCSKPVPGIPLNSFLSLKSFQTLLFSKKYVHFHAFGVSLKSSKPVLGIPLNSFLSSKSFQILSCIKNLFIFMHLGSH